MRGRVGVVSGSEGGGESGCGVMRPRGDTELSGASICRSAGFRSRACSGGVCAAGGQEEETAGGAQWQSLRVWRFEVCWRLERDLVPVCQELGRGEQAQVRAWYQAHVTDSESHCLIEAILN